MYVVLVAIETLHNPSSTQSADGVVVEVSLATYSGDQFFSHTLDPFSGAPGGDYNGIAIPAAFGDPTAHYGLAPPTYHTCFRDGF